MSRLPRFLVFLSSRAMPHSGSTRPTNKTKSSQPFLQSYNASGEAKISSERNKSFSRRKQSVSPHETKCFTRMEQSVSRAWNNVCHRHGTNASLLDTHLDAARLLLETDGRDTLQLFQYDRQARAIRRDRIGVTQSRGIFYLERRIVSPGQCAHHLR